MGIRFRKSIKIAPGVRANFGTKSAGLSFGTRGMRYSVNSSGRRTATVGIPGTGLSYSTSSYGKSRSKTYADRQAFKELERQQKALEAEQEVAKYNNYIESIQSIHKECDDQINWDHINNCAPPFDLNSKGPAELKALEQINNYKPGIFAKIFKSLEKSQRSKLEDNLYTAMEADRDSFESWKNLNELSSMVLRGDLEGYLMVIDQMDPLDDLLEFGSGFEFGAVDKDTLVVNFDVKMDSVVPTESKSLTQTGRLSSKKIGKTAYYELAQDYVCSCAIRIARDMFALLPLTTVIVNAQDTVLDTSNGYHEVKTILSVKFDKDTVNSLNMDSIDPSDSLQNFEHNMKFLKTKGFQSVDEVLI